MAHGGGVRRPGIREAVPTSEYPNLRDDGIVIDGWLLSTLTRLQRRHGYAFASEAGLRLIICEDYGHMPGVGTVPAALKRLALEGKLVDVWLTRGNIMPDGSMCKYGTHLAWVPATRRQRATARHFNREYRARARRGYRNRITGHDVRKLVSRLVTGEPRSAPTAADLEEKRARDRDALRAWAEAERAAGRDPDTPG